MSLLNEDIYILITAQLTGEELSNEEQQQLDEWLKNTSNKEEFEEIRSIYLSRTNLKLFDQIEVPQNFPPTVSQKNKTSRLFRKHWLKYAAVIIPLIVLSVISLKWYTNSHLNQNTDIEPGETRATLIIGDNKQIALNKSGNLIKQGVLGHGEEEGVLRYENVGEALPKENNVIHTIKVERGGEYQLMLADGTKVWLNSDSELSYPVDFRGKKSRTVRLRGEGYFEVAQQEEQPFIVELSEGAVTVLGTHFNISDYSDENKITTTLLEGKVNYKSKEGERTLTPGQLCIYDKSNMTTAIKNIASNHDLWKDGVFVFENITIEELGRQISRWYDVDIHFNETATKSISFTGSMERYKPVSYILQLLEETNTVKSKIDDGVITFSSI